MKSAISRLECSAPAGFANRHIKVVPLPATATTPANADGHYAPLVPDVYRDDSAWRYLRRELAAKPCGG